MESHGETLFLRCLRVWWCRGIQPTHSSLHFRDLANQVGDEFRLEVDVLDQAPVLLHELVRLFLSASHCRRSHVSNTLLEHGLVVFHGGNCLFNPLKVLLLVTFLCRLPKSP